MILCSANPLSIIKAALLAQIHHDLPCIKGDQESLGLFKFTHAYDADSIALTTLIPQIQDACGLNAKWLLEHPGKILQKHISANLRYRSTDKTLLIFAALEHTLRYGPVYCFTGRTTISQLFISRAKAIAHEIHQTLAFIRFLPASDTLLIAQPRLFHDTAEIIIRKFSCRYPGIRLVLLLEDQALMLENDQLLYQPAADFSRSIPHKAAFNKSWEAYHQAQCLAALHNIRLAQKAIPQKYWDWAANRSSQEQQSN